MPQRCDAPPLLPGPNQVNAAPLALGARKPPQIAGVERAARPSLLHGRDLTA